MKKLLSLLVLTLTACSTVTTERDALLIAGPSTVILTADKTLSTGGTGFQIKYIGKEYIVSNAHVCDIAKNKQTVAHLSNGETRIVKILDVSTRTDLCLLEPVRGLPYLYVSEKEGIVPYKKYFKVGHAYLRPNNVTSGYLIDRSIVMVPTNTPENLCVGGKNALVPVDIFPGFSVLLCVEVVDAQGLNMVVLPGDSGSPVVNEEGQVVGVAFASDNSSHWGFVVPHDVLLEFLENAQAF